MQDIIELFIDYLKGIWVKRRFIVISTWLLCPISWIYITQLDDVYESKARVYADTQTILGPLLKGLTIKTNPEMQLRLMIKTLLSTPNIERISRMTDLDITAQSPDDYQELIDDLKSDIIIKKTGGRRENIFEITYRHRDAEMAKKVVNSALTVFIENTLGENRSDSDTAQRFLEAQIKEYEDRLLVSEEKLKNFKQKYNNVLPSQYGGYYQKLTIAKQQLKDSQLALLEVQTQLKTTQKQLASAIESVEKNEEQNNIVGAGSIQTTYDSRIKTLQETLDSLQLKYTNKHPDIIEANRRLKILNQQRNKEIKAFVKSNKNNSDTKLTISDNPVIQQLQINESQLKNQLASIKVRHDDHQQIVNDLKAKIHVLPEVEAELTSLNRGYNITKSKYEELLDRRETAQLAKQADESTNPIQFRVIDPPRAPKTPIGPMRVLFLIGSTIFAFAIGVALSLLFSQISPVVTSGSQISKQTGIPVFGVVSATKHLGLQEWHNKKRLIFILSNGLLLILLLCFIAYAVAPNLILAPIKGIL